MLFTAHGRRHRDLKITLLLEISGNMAHEKTLTRTEKEKIITLCRCYVPSNDYLAMTELEKVVIPLNGPKTPYCLLSPWRDYAKLGIKPSMVNIVRSCKGTECNLKDILGLTEESNGIYESSQ